MNTDAQTSGPDPEPENAAQPEAQPTAQAQAQPEARPEAQPQAQPQELPEKEQPRKRSDRPRTGPIVWGALILAFCGYVMQRTLTPGDIDAAVWITAITIGLGVLLLAVGGAVLIRNRR